MNSTPVSVFFFKGTPSPPFPSIPFALLAARSVGASDYCIVWLRGSLGDRGQWASPLPSVHPPPHVHFRRRLLSCPSSSSAAADRLEASPAAVHAAEEEDIKMRNTCVLGAPFSLRSPPLLPCIQLPQTTTSTACCPFPCPPAAAPQSVRRFGGDFSPDRRGAANRQFHSVLGRGRREDVTKTEKREKGICGYRKREKPRCGRPLTFSQCGSILYPR